MTISSLASAGENARMDSSRPRAGSPQRRTFSPADKLAHLAAYEQACETNDGGAYLRREGLYSSLICEWRKQRDAGVLAGKPAGTKVGEAMDHALETSVERLRDHLRRPNPGQREQLEHVSHMAGPGDAGAEDDCCAVDDGEFVVAGGQAAPLLE